MVRAFLTEDTSGPVGAASCRNRRSDWDHPELSRAIVFHGLQKQISLSIHSPAFCGGEINSFFSRQLRPPCWLLVPPQGIMGDWCISPNLESRDEVELLYSLPWHSMGYWLTYLRHTLDMQKMGLCFQQRTSKISLQLILNWKIVA